MLFPLLLFFFPLITLNAFVVDPWFNALAEFTFRPSYTCRYSHSAPNYVNRHTLHTNHIALNLGVRFLPYWEAQVETDFSKAGAQIRYLLFEDVAGDLFSMVLGGQLLYVFQRRVHKATYHHHQAQANLRAEVGISIGKESATLYQWLHRFYGFLGIGLDDRGHPWVRPFLSQEIKVARRHLLQLFAEGYVGLKSIVSHYSTCCVKRRPRSAVDLGIGYTYLLTIWGALSIRYTHHIYAHAGTRQAHHSLRVEYCLPFSLL